jgi:hypothetical protein
MRPMNRFLWGPISKKNKKFKKNKKQTIFFDVALIAVS